MTARIVDSSAVFGLKMFKHNCKFVGTANPDFISKLQTLDDAQSIVDALHLELSRKYNEELDWLYSTFFTSHVPPPSCGEWNLTRN